MDYLAPTILLLGGLYLGFVDRTRLPVRGAVALKRLLGVLLIAASLWAAIPGAPEAVMPWQPYSETAMAAARAAPRPVLIDFYATWCPPCRQLDRHVFSRQKVVDAAAPFVVLRADLSDQTSAATQRLAEQFQIYGFPTVVFIGTDGQERRALRLLGFEGPDKFVRRLQAVK